MKHLSSIHRFLFLLLCLGGFSALAQTPITQTVRGTITDKVSQSPIPGAVVVLAGSDPLNGTSTDEQGNFRLTNVPVGRATLRITFLGYKEVTMPNLTVNAGKELVLNVPMEEDIVNADEVVVTAKQEKNKPLNDMSTVSTRAFSVEETQKFAASVNDPARMASSFAGVVQGMDGNNTISIRGNSPNGLLWRMEGVEIPNPNHFSSVGTSGGGISILNAQLLSNSDFITGAFAAEYGNALSGVFDLRLRKGNNQKREYTFQAGMIGIDAAAEGPFKKGYDGSFLLNYRYSTFTLFNLVGLKFFGDAVPQYQDLSLNINLPTKKLGTFSIFGFGGLSVQNTKAKSDSVAWKDDDFTRYNSKFFANTGAAGITHVKLVGSKSYVRSAVVFSGTGNGYMQEKLNSEYVPKENYDEKYSQTKLTVTSTYTHKISARSSLRTGFIVNFLGYGLKQKGLYDSTVMVERLNVKGNTSTVQGYVQWQHKLGTRFTTNLGLHYLQLMLNNSNSLEPRASVKYDISSRQSLSLGYGLHGQIQPIGVYFVRQPVADGSYTTPNEKLGLSKAHHLVLSYDRNLNEFTHVKTEVYYQHLFHVPVSRDPNNTFSMLNVTDGYNTESLVNKGQGRNYGLELTLERFLHRNFYYLLSASLYESKYRSSNGTWHDTRFNTNYAGSFTAGKEWVLSEKRKGRIIGFNIKAIYAGGLRYSAVDLQKSIAAGETKFDETDPFSKKNPDYFRCDIRLSLKRNYKHVTSTVAFDIQNVTNRRNVGGQYYDLKTGSVKYFYQVGMIPILSYRIEF